jgi:putative membrane protein
MHDGVVLLRSGALWRRLVVVPLARMQSVEVRQGPLRRMLSLASAELHTVEGPVHARLSVIDPDASLQMFTEVAEGAVTWAGADTSHRWNATDAATSTPLSGQGSEE